MDEQPHPSVSTNVVRCVSHARIGLLGNPSDGYGGKCLSLSLANYAAEVTLTPAADVRFEPNPDGDADRFPSLDSFARHVDAFGYDGGRRLLMAMVRRFAGYCRERSITLDAGRGFSLAYTTNIPRQRGLSGSSALACAVLGCLLQHYAVGDRVPIEDRPALVLSAEQELGIAAGLQDRVVQVLGGLVYMDFSTAAPRYETIDASSLPRLYLLHSAAPPGKSSGGVHGELRRRWEAGDEPLRALMVELAGLAHRARQVLLDASGAAAAAAALAPLMRRNFAIRRGLFGDAALGPDNLRMVAVAESVGAAAKLTGSGGAVVALCPEGEGQEGRLRAACQEAGIVCELVRVGPVLHVLP